MQMTTQWRRNDNADDAEKHTATDYKCFNNYCLFRRFRFSGQRKLGDLEGFASVDNEGKGDCFYEVVSTGLFETTQHMESIRVLCLWAKRNLIIFSKIIFQK